MSEKEDQPVMYTVGARRREPTAVPRCNTVHLQTPQNLRTCAQPELVFRQTTVEPSKLAVTSESPPGDQFTDLIVFV